MYHAPDEELWNDMKRALNMVPMSLSSHQQIQGIFAQVEQQALSRSLRVEAAQRQAPRRGRPPAQPPVIDQ